MNFIREAVIEDIHLLAEIFDQYRIFYEKKSDIDSAKIFLGDRIKLGESKIFISMDDDVITGFVQLYPIFSSTQMKRLWLLNDLFVDPKFRGQGISKKLIEECKRHSVRTNASGLILETAKSNTIGNHLYPSVDFNLDQDHNYYYWENNAI
jgi:ribosomal protein S18 acetylase RimI-like enzyme